MYVCMYVCMYVYLFMCENACCYMYIRVAIDCMCNVCMVPKLFRSEYGGGGGGKQRHVHSGRGQTHRVNRVAGGAAHTINLGACVCMYVCMNLYTV